ncbi:hypothetical protein EJ03DRAFT_210745 [Teratosphaeria nubilosa]|uniref:CMP/dCMP-type deaminase domain-containing protein n=1 Tax=Teratosphaeria nubilosa TaxID=161662 RepID=A0A6G1KXB4_9PEZI|nr:hypothetical protein EJ03DRAFT_210745 [Teratosphaeria nubilosa]
MRKSEPPQPEPMLLQKGHTSSNTVDRKKHTRLLGADLYVARLGWNKSRERLGNALTAAVLPAPPTSNYAIPQALHRDAMNEDSNAVLTSSAASLSSTASSSSGSLHDELLDPLPRPSHPNPPTSLDFCAPAASCVRESRPCYRCISYMHSVGIKRVFWTNDDGVWEGGKVRDLVDALDNSMESVADGGPLGNSVFVTKHEVLMLKRMMGEEKK